MLYPTVTIWGSGISNRSDMASSFKPPGTNVSVYSPSFKRSHVIWPLSPKNFFVTPLCLGSACAHLCFCNSSFLSGTWKRLDFAAELSVGACCCIPIWLQNLLSQKEHNLCLLLQLFQWLHSRVNQSWSLVTLGRSLLLFIKKPQQHKPENLNQAPKSHNKKSCLA